MSFSMTDDEREYWQKASIDPDVDRKYIADVDTQKCFDAIGTMSGRVLEIGCGVGRLMKPGYFGIDISSGMLEKAIVRTDPTCEYKLCDGRTIPYEMNYFDFVYCMLVFQHLPFDAVTAYISEVSRVLKHNGIFRFQFIEGNENEPFSKHHDMLNMSLTLKKYGLKITKNTRGLVHPQWTWITAVKG